MALSAAICGDSIGYLVGREWGSNVFAWLEHTDLASHLLPARTVIKAQSYFERYGGWAVFVSRSLLGTLSGVMNVFADARSLPFRALLAYDLAGEMIDMVGMLAIGWAARTGWEAGSNDVRMISLMALGTLALALLVLSWQQSNRRTMHRGHANSHEDW